MPRNFEALRRQVDDELARHPDGERIREEIRRELAAELAAVASEAHVGPTLDKHR
jgi:hypothetical protein